MKLLKLMYKPLKCGFSEEGCQKKKTITFPFIYNNIRGLNYSLSKEPLKSIIMRPKVSKNLKAFFDVLICVNPKKNPEKVRPSKE